MQPIHNRRLQVAAGPTVAAIVSAVTLTTAMMVAGFPVSALPAPVTVLLAIRLICIVARSAATPALTAPVSTPVVNVLKDEGKIALGFLGAIYVFGWPLPVTTTALFLGANLVLQVGASELAARISRRGRVSPDHNIFTDRKQVVVVGSGRSAQRLIDSLAGSPETGVGVKGILDYRRTGFWRYRDIPLLGHPDNLPSLAAAQHIDALVLAVEPDELAQTRDLFMAAESMGIPVCVVTEFFQPRISTVTPTWLNGSPALWYQVSPRGGWSQAAKQIVDKVGALAGILLTLPVMILSALAVKLDSRGPVLFQQKRCGLNGQQFVFYKFRTMCVDAEQKKQAVAHLNVMSGPVFKAKDDPRITRVGKLLRRWSIDELPQLFNVLRGDMSLVGPRPPLPGEVARYEPWQRRRLSVKPGVTCLWQVNGRNHIDFDKWMQLDLEYIDNWSLGLDAKILARTVPAVLKGTGAH
ncbi:MAG: sugar transferase [Candidatus Zixiibacteriota bacterium]